MKAFKGAFLAAALLTSVPVLTFLAPSGYAQEEQFWYVLVAAPNAEAPYKFYHVRTALTRADANTAVEYCRVFAGQKGVHAIPEAAYIQQVDAGLIGEDASLCP